METAAAIGSTRAGDVGVAAATPLDQWIHDRRRARFVSVAQESSYGQQLSPMPSAVRKTVSKDTFPLLQERVRLQARESLRSALLSRDSDRVLEVFNEVSNDLEIIRSIPSTTFSEILRILDPVKSTQLNRPFYNLLGESREILWGVRPLKETFREHVEKLSTAVSARRAAGIELTYVDYQTLLGYARVMGMATMAEGVWQNMKEAGMKPNTPCYNHYIGAMVWNDYARPDHKTSLRTTPFSLSNRTPRSQAARDARRIDNVWSSFTVGSGGSSNMSRRRSRT